MRLLAIVLLCAASGCALLQDPYVPDASPVDAGRLAPPDVAVEIANLHACTDSPDRTVRFNSGQPVTVLVHGCNGSAGRFRELAQLFAFHGQQALCFTYDARDSLVVSSGQLIHALDALAGHVGERGITVIGHSVGGLIARKALEESRRDEWQRHDARIQLATVSAPLAGIAAAGPCASPVVQWATLGVVPALCWAVSGDSWNEITAPSDFIRRPGPMLSSLQRYLKVVTDERDTCRRRGEGGACRESDYVFSLAEQYQGAIDQSARVTNVEVSAGHVEIVGYKNVAPRKLLAILQQQGMLASTPPGRVAALEKLLADLY